MEYNREKIKENLKNKYFGKNIIFLKETDSTNDECKRHALNGAYSGTVIIAEHQKKGRGRMGRNWYSSPDGGIYMSLLLKPKISLDKSFLLTFIAALTVQKAIAHIANLDTDIKWPNDILINNRKVCGILTESKLLNTSIEYLVVGIGVNVNIPEFHKDIENVAVSLKMCSGSNLDINLLVVEILNEYENYYNLLLQGKESCILKEYKKKCITIGTFVKVKNNGQNIEGHGIDVDKSGNLIIKTKDDELLNISSGEAALRGFEGYLGY